MHMHCKSLVGGPLYIKVDKQVGLLQSTYLILDIKKIICYTVEQRAEILYLPMEFCIKIMVAR